MIKELKPLKKAVMENTASTGAARPAEAADVNNYEVEGATVLGGDAAAKKDKTAALNNYIVTLRHDAGQARICLAATSAAQAKKTIINTEGCPAGAIRSVKRA